MEFELTGNETPEELETLLETLGDVDISDTTAASTPATATATPEITNQQTVTDQINATQTSAGDTSNDTPTPGVTAEQQNNGTSADNDPGVQPKGILSKDGKHVIPYDVLEAERAERRRIAESGQRTEAELADARRQLEVFTRQINAAGLQPAQLPEKTQITPEQINAVRESFPDLAGVLDALVQKVEYLQGTHVQSSPTMPSATTPATADPLMMALDATPDLKAWQGDDPDRFTLACHIDGALQHDPAWKDKPLTERFGEVVKRTRAAYGEAVSPPQSSATPEVTPPTTEELQKKATEALAAATAVASVPASPSDIGSTATSATSQIEQAANASPEQLQVMFAGMTDAQIDALLEQAI